MKEFKEDGLMKYFVEVYKFFEVFVEIGMMFNLLNIMIFMVELYNEYR